MTRRLIRVIREYTKSHFGISEEAMSVAEEKANLILYPNDEGKLTGGYGLEFWSEALQKQICLVFPPGYFDYDDQEDEE
nr:MAG TPA: hypothetical protein [Caudoviricetes sp.]